MLTLSFMLTAACITDCHIEHWYSSVSTERI